MTFNTTSKLLSLSVLGVLIGIMIIFFRYQDKPTPILYHVSDLGVLPGFTINIVKSGNNSDVLVGTGATITSTFKEGGAYSLHAYVYLKGRYIRIDDNHSNFDSEAYGVNDHNEVVGRMFPPNTLSADHAFLWRKGVLQDIGSLGGNSTVAQDINDKSQIVGTSELKTSSSLTHAFLWDHGHIRDLGTLNNKAGSAAYAINNQSQVVGETYEGHAFLWDKGKLFDLGTLGGPNSAAKALNEDAEVVGQADIRTQKPIYTHAFFWKKNNMKDLGTLGGNLSVALAINNNHFIVGWAQVSSGMHHAFLWHNGTMIDLNSAISFDDLKLEEAVHINDRGEILCTGRIKDQYHSFLLKPLKP